MILKLEPYIENHYYEHLRQRESVINNNLSHKDKRQLLLIFQVIGWAYCFLAL